MFDNIANEPMLGGDSEINEGEHESGLNSNQGQTYWGGLQQYCQLSEMNKKCIFGAAFGVVLILAAGIYFSVAFTTCNKYILTNKTSDIIYGEYTSPYGSKSSGAAVVLPELSATFKPNGVNSYLDWVTTEGTVHWSNHGKKVVLKGGVADREVIGPKTIFFQQCYYHYQEKQPSGNQKESAQIATNLRGKNKLGLI